MLRFSLFVASFFLLVTSLVAVLDYWQYEGTMPDVAQLMRQGVTAADLEARIEGSIDGDNPDDARMYLGIAQTFGYALDTARFLPRIEALETPWHVARRRFEQFTDGFIDGDGSTGAGVAGAIAADFTVVGDVRDLYEQYELSEEGKAVNELVVALAGIGVGLTAATVATSGSAAPLKTGSSALKLASRTGRVSPRLQKLLLRQANDVFDYKAFLLAVRGDKSIDNIRQAALSAYQPRALKALGETTSRVNNIRNSTSLVDTVDMLRYVETADDLRRLEKVSSRYGTQTKGILKLLGKGAIGTVRVLRHGAELVVALVATLLSVLATVLATGGLFTRKAA